MFSFLNTLFLFSVEYSFSSVYSQLFVLFYLIFILVFLRSFYTLFFCFQLNLISVQFILKFLFYFT